ncbi:DUF1992 domain-containing protein [Streptosporangium sp. NPDC002524]|uniref:DnaJ family domain-containing protein n=1 Tax=Streptosporangium sp. NPDC002524 TaxID=3154537 RepID=UPI00333077C0
MTERKPPGVGFETWIDRQIREATERGEFDNLPGTGKPLPGEGKPHDEMWWIKQKMLEENLAFPLPGTLALRKEVEESVAEALGARTEAEARAIVDGMNDRIRESHGRTLSGPPLFQPLIDVEKTAADWRALHPAREKPAPVPEPPRERRSLLRFFQRKGHG